MPEQMPLPITFFLRVCQRMSATANATPLLTVATPSPRTMTRVQRQDFFLSPISISILLTKLLVMNES